MSDTVAPTDYADVSPLRELAEAEGFDLSETKGRHWFKATEGYPGTPEYKLKGVAYVDLHSVATLGALVAPDHRHSQVATALVDYILGWLHEEGCRSVYWQIPASVVGHYRAHRQRDTIMAVGAKTALVVGHPEKYAVPQ